MFWIDLETTGLEPQTNEVLEIGAIVTDQWGRVESKFETTVRHDPKMYNWNMSTETVVKTMHAESGLFQEVINGGGGKARPKAWHDLGMFLDDNGLNKQPMCGSSVPFDRAFMTEHAPEVASMFHNYRNIDVSSHRESMKLVNPSLAARMEEELKPQGKHRVFPDLLDSINMYRWMLVNFLEIEEPVE